MLPQLGLTGNNEAVARSDIVTIETQLSSPQPKVEIIKESLRSNEEHHRGDVGNLRGFRDHRGDSEATWLVNRGTMHILDYLTDAEHNIRVDEDSVVHFEPRLDKDSVRIEYRLICSGMFYPKDFLSDWSHSDVARILLSLPVELLVASHPYDSYPQELVLRFVVPLVKETDGKVSSLYHPDQEIASDFAALLTLLCRRLVTVAVKAPSNTMIRGFPPILADCPIAAATTATLSYWRDARCTFSTTCTAFRSRATTPRLHRSTLAESSEYCSRFRNGQFLPPFCEQHDCTPWRWN